MQAAIARDRIVFALEEPSAEEQTPSQVKERSPGQIRDHPPASPRRKSKTRYVFMYFEGANPDSEIYPERPQPGIYNYLKGSDPSLWVTDVEGYSALRIKDIYPGIDLYLEDKKGEIAYSFFVSERADPDLIELRFETELPLSLSDEGELLIGTESAKLTHSAPFAYQGGKENPVEVSFALEENRASFSLGDYDKDRPLVIDPTLSYSTYLGGWLPDSPPQLMQHDYGYAIAVDSIGSAYVTGQTLSSNFPTVAPFQTNPDALGIPDAFVTKFAPSGSSVVYSTYLGGGGGDIGRGIAVDSSGAAYVIGQTGSSDFPTASPYQSYQGGWDAFLTKLSPSGNSLSYSTFLGGSADDYGWDVAVLPSGAAYVTGWTYSSNFPTAFQLQSHQGGADAFVARLVYWNSSLLLSYSTFLGGTQDDFGAGIAVDAWSVYVTGHTLSTNFTPISPVAPFSYKKGVRDAFVTKLSFTGSSLLVPYSTYLGGTGEDFGEDIAVDSSEFAYLVGWTDSTDFFTASAYQGDQNGIDAFVTKVGPTGTYFPYSTYLGGSSDDSGQDIAVDSSGAAYITGWTDSSDFPTLAPYQTDQGGRDAFVTRLSPSGNAVSDSTYLGGNFADRGADIAVDSQGTAYVTGETGSSDFPTVNAFQTDPDGANNLDAFVTKLTALHGTITGGIGGSISVYSAATGQLVRYFCCMTSEIYSVWVPPSSCPSGGYKILWLPPDQTKAPTWYNQKTSFSQADCISSPGSASWTAITAAELSGMLKSDLDGSPLDQGIIYAYDSSTGGFSGWAESGAAGLPGQYRLLLSPGTYKLKVVPPSGYVSEWHKNAYSYTDASLIAAPQTGVEISVTPSAAIQGYTKNALTAADLDFIPVYAYRTDGSFFGYTLSGGAAGQGRYRIEAIPGTPLKLFVSGGPFYFDQWWSGASRFAEASATTPPATANFSLVPIP